MCYGQPLPATWNHIAERSSLILGDMHGRVVRVGVLSPNQSLKLTATTSGCGTKVL